MLALCALSCGTVGYFQDTLLISSLPSMLADGRTPAFNKTADGPHLVIAGLFFSCVTLAVLSIGWCDPDIDNDEPGTWTP